MDALLLLAKEMRKMTAAVEKLDRWLINHSQAPNQSGRVSAKKKSREREREGKRRARQPARASERIEGRSR